jgi:UDP-N-acetylmuramate--alanine ligase
LVPEADIQARAIRATPGETVFTVARNNETLGDVRWGVPGRHNVINSLAAIAAGLELGVPFPTIAQALASFQGVGRRFELKGEQAGVTVVDDYGHHPTEIKATLQALKERYPGRRTVVVFQPHRYSRTQALTEQFSNCFSQADALYLLDIYAASEAPIPGVTSDALAKRLASNGVPVQRFPTAEGPAQLAARVKPGDVVLTLGAGDVWKWGESLLGSLAR